MAYVKMIPYIWIPSAPKIYGAEWAGGADPSWTRTDDAAGLSDPNPAVSNGNGNSPFDTIYPWKDMKRMEDSAAGTLVEIPKFYYKWIRSGTKMKLLITDRPSDGFFVSPAHADRGDGKGERDVVYVGRYKCTNNYKSETGYKPICESMNSNISGIHSLGNAIWLSDYAMFWTIRMLYLVEFAHWNSQAKIGYGCGSGASGDTVVGYTDSMSYHTGTTQTLRNTYGFGTQYRYIEGLWDNVFEMIGGIRIRDLNIYCYSNPSDFNTSSGGVQIGTRHTSSGYTTALTIPSIIGFEYGLLPQTTDSSLDGSTYICDYYSYLSQSQSSSTNMFMRVGGDTYNGQGYGLFRINFDMQSASLASANIGSRLMKLP